MFEKSKEDKIENSAEGTSVGGLIQKIPPYLAGGQATLYDGLRRANERIFKIFNEDKDISFIRVFGALLSSDDIIDLYKRVVEIEAYNESTAEKKSPPQFEIYLTLSPQIKYQLLKYTNQIQLFAVSNGLIRIRKIGDATLIRFLENILKYAGGNLPPFKDEANELLKALYIYRDNERKDREKKEREEMPQNFI